MASPSNTEGDLARLQEALAEARAAAKVGEVPVGALAVLDGRVIGRGHNLREKLQSPTAHAELLAIAAAAAALGSWRLERVELFVTLEPCPMCLAACQQARIARVIYGATDPKGGALSLGYKLHEDPRTNHRFAVEHVAHEDCGKILRDFFAERRSGQRGKPDSIR